MIPKVGETFTGTVVQVAQFGVFVEHPGGSHGLLYGQTADEGLTVQVRVLDVDEQRRRFSLELA